MLHPVILRFNRALEGYFPEQRLFLKSDTATRFIRLRPVTQAIAVVVGAVALAWTVLATSILMLDQISAGSSREQVKMQQMLYEDRLGALSTDRDLRAEETASAQARFNLALAQVSQMQARLLASEDRRRELETGIDVIQNTLRRTIRERDAARSELDEMQLALDAQGDRERTEAGMAEDTLATLEIMTQALGSTAQERDAALTSVEREAEKVAAIAAEKRALEARNEVIFAQLEEALTVSVEPLKKMFRAAGLSPDELLESVRKGYNGQGGPLTPISLSTKGTPPSSEELRANTILRGLDEVNLYRIAAFKAPFAMPVHDTFRYSSGFGVRQDPKGWGTRMHEGTDMAGAQGTAILSTADGTVTHAGWKNGYGNLVEIKHAFGISTRYGHLSKVRVEVGQKVSRGDLIGDMGNTGRSTGTHLHYEVRIGGTAVNPMTFIKAATHVF